MEGGGAGRGGGGGGGGVAGRGRGHKVLLLLLVLHRRVVVVVLLVVIVIAAASVASGGRCVVPLLLVPLFLLLLVVIVAAAAAAAVIAAAVWARLPVHAMLLQVPLSLVHGVEALVAIAGVAVNLAAARVPVAVYARHPALRHRVQAGPPALAHLSSLLCYHHPAAGWPRRLLGASGQLGDGGGSQATKDASSEQHGVPELRYGQGRPILKMRGALAAQRCRQRQLS